MRVAEVLVMVPKELDTMTWKIEPLSARVVTGVMYELDVAPWMFVPSFSHRYKREPPLATTLKVAVWPAVTVLLTGWVRMEGAAMPAVVKVRWEAGPDQFP